METRTSGVPASAPHELRRERLLEVLHKHRTRPLILLVAPAGFGKSTLAATYARDSGGAVAWLTLQAADRDTRRLFTRLGDALDAGFGEAEPGSVPNLRKGLAEGAEGVGLARLLLDDLAQAPAGFIIVLDDFHLVDESDEVVNAIDALIRDLPEAGQIVITARSAPGLSMTRLVVEGAVFPLGTEDLRLTHLETRELREKLGGDDAHDFDAEGWVTGILLGGAPSQLGMAGASLLAGYVEGEILARLSPEEQLWLESLSIFDTITPRIAEAVFGPGPWPARLLALSARCPFLVRGEDGSYRLHALIRDTVFHRLRRNPDDRHFQAWSVARDLAEEASDAAGVVRACEELGDINGAVEVLMRKAGEEVRRGRWSAVLLNFEPLPETVRRAHPQLSLIEARALLNTGRPDRAYAVAEAALQHAVRSGDVFIQISALIELATASFGSNLSAAEDWLSAAEHLLRTSNLPASKKHLLEGKAFDIRGICSAMSGDVAAAQEAFESGVRVLRTLGPSRELAIAQHNFGSFCNRIGDYTRAEQALAAAASHWRIMGDSIGRASSQTVRGDLLLHLGNLDEAGAALNDAHAAAQSVGALRMEAWATESLGQWHRANGRIHEAIDAFEQSIGLAEQIVERELLTEVLVCRAEVALLQKDYDKARELLARAQAEGQQAGSSAALAAVDRALGRLHLEDGAGSRAIEHLKQALERAGDSWGPDQRAQTLYWLGTAYFQVDRAQLANNCLVQAVELVRKTNLPGLLAAPAAEAPGLLQAGRKLGVDPVILAEVDRLAATRRPWTGIERDAGPKLAADNELPRIEVQLFDSFVLHRNGQLIQKTSRKINRAGELAALLILHPKGLSDETIAGMMFPDKPEHTAQHNLQMAVYALRRDLASKVAIRYSAHMYQLTPEMEVIADVREFDAALADARGASGAALIEALARAVDLYKGPLLANAGWDWLEPVRLEYQERYVGAALQLADILALTDLERSDTLAANVLAAAPGTELAYERLLLNAAARQDSNAVRRIRSRYEQAAVRYGFSPSSHLGAGSSIRARASR